MKLPEHTYGLSVIVVTIDSLRWDVSQEAFTPNLNAMFDQHDARWMRAYAQGTYTLPAHVALFQGGHIPLNVLDNDAPPVLRYDEDKTMFRVTLNWTRNKQSHFPLPEAANMVKGFERLGYRTVGVGGVHWFDLRFETSRSLWSNYFSEFYWQPNFSEENPDGFKEQIAFVAGLGLRREIRPLFFFLNISTTHTPCRGEATIQGQRKALEWVDRLMPSLFAHLPERAFVLLLSDHGTLFGDDGLRHHGFYHPKVMEVPIAWFTMGI